MPPLPLLLDATPVQHIEEAVEGGEELAFGEVTVGAEDDDDASGDLAIEAERVLEGVGGGHEDKDSMGGKIDEVSG